MIKSFLAAGTALAFSMGVAHAEPMTKLVDNFTTVQTVTDSTAGDGGMETQASISVDGYNHTRWLSVTQTMHDDQAQTNNESMAEIRQGTLALTNDDFVNAEFGLRYALDDALVKAFKGSTDLTLRVLFSDLAGAGEKPFTIEAFLNGEAVGDPVAITTRSADVSFALDDFLAMGNILSFRFTGDWSFDATMGPISVLVQDGGTSGVPEPAALGLLGLGLTGVAVARRRKVRA